MLARQGSQKVLGEIERPFLYVLRVRNKLGEAREVFWVRVSLSDTEVKTRNSNEA